MKGYDLNHLCILEKKSGPKIDPWGTPACTGDKEDVWPFKRTRWYLPLKKL